MEIQFVVFLVFALISLFRAMNQAKNKNQQEQVNRGEAPARRQKVQSEIEAFLTEVKSAAGTAAPEQQQQQQEARKRARQRRRQQARKAQQQAQPEVASRPLGSGISDHVDSYISQHVEDHVDSKVDGLVEVDIADTVKDHLGDRATELPKPTRASAADDDASARFRELLKSREGVRQAILLNEVLARPRSLRR